MKCLLLLLVCVAAASASSYTYSYYCSHNFNVYPSSKCYSYQVYFPSSWCSSDYYNNILKVYPGDDCSNDSWQETSPSAIMSQVQNLLNSAKTKMSQDMYSKRDQFIAKIDSTHAEFKDNYKKFLTKFYADRVKCGYFKKVNYTKQRDDKIKAYNASLDKARNNIYKKYTDAIGKKIDSITAYHAKIVKEGTECLNTRLTKVTQYRESMINKAYDASVKFGKLHLSILQQNKENYEKSLRSAFGKHDNLWWAKFKAYLSLQTYYNTQRTLVEKHIRAYTYKLTVHYKQLVKFYTCAYKCYMSNACLRFYSKSYSNYCQKHQFSYKSDFKTKKFTMSPFDHPLKLPTFKNLKTCDVGQEARDAAKVISDLKQKMKDTLEANSSKFTTWKNKWVGNFRDYKKAFEKIVRDSHASYISKCKGSTQQYQAKLNKQLKDVCAKYNQALDDKIADAEKAHTKNQDKYKKAMESFISKLQTKYDDCASKKKVAVADYEKKLDDKIKADKAAFASSVRKSMREATADFGKMLTHYLGENYKDVTVHKNLYNDHCNAVYALGYGLINTFNTFWDNTSKKLVLHYTCNYKCSIDAKCSTSYNCGSFYSWTYKLPVAKSYTCTI